ncbi:hypothetical protein QYF61_014389, partial [Mycteria americana]
MDGANAPDLPQRRVLSPVDATYINETRWLFTTSLKGGEELLTDRETFPLLPATCMTVPAIQRSDEDNCSAPSLLRERSQSRRHRCSELPSHITLWVGRDLYRSSSPTPLQEQGHLQLDQVAQSPVQPDLEGFQGWGIYHLSGQPVPVPHHPHLLAGCYKVSLEPSLLQAEQPQLSQPVLVGEVLQPSDHFCDPPLDSLQQLHLCLVLRTPELDAVLRDTVGLLGCERTLSAHAQFFVHQYPQVLFRRAALKHIIPQPVSKPRIAPTRCRTLHLALLNLMRFTQAHFSSLSRSLWMTSRPSDLSTAPLSLVSSANLLSVHLISLSMSLMKTLNSTGPTIDRYPLDATIQTIPCPLNGPPIKSISLQFREKDVVGDRVACPCFHCLCSSLLLFSLTSRSRLSHAGLFPSLPDFLHLGTESSCTLWKASLKICQLCSAPLSLRTISQGILLNNSLKSWKFAFLKFGVLTILLACPISLRTVNSTNAASNLDVTDELTCIGDHQVQYRIPSGRGCGSITWLKKLSSMHSRSLPDCLQLAMLLFQQMSGWLKTPSRTRACEREASCSWRRKAS